MDNSRIIFSLLITLLLVTVSSCVGNKSELDWKELAPILSQNNLTVSTPADSHKDIGEIEAADSKLYAPVRGTTIYLESQTPIPGQDRFKPKYWLRIEDYESAARASKRAAEYRDAEAFERIAAAYRNVEATPPSVSDSDAMSKASVRMWAVARGKRVYALTTNASSFTYLDPPKRLKQAIESLPEK